MPLVDINHGLSTIFNSKKLEFYRMLANLQQDSMSTDLNVGGCSLEFVQ